MKYKTIYIGGINRSGGSLIPRLFDNHSKILSYPVDLAFSSYDKYYDVTDTFAGIPQRVPSFDTITDVYETLNIPKNKPEVSTTWGKERSDPIGIRANYLEKAFYDIVEARFDYEKFIKRFERYSSIAKNIDELFSARHKAYFKTWNDGNLFNNQTHVVMQSSGGLYLSNIDEFFKNLSSSVFIIPIRDILGYVAAEKIRLARIYFGSRRYSKPILPFYFVKKFNNYDLDAQIRSWNTSVTRARILQERYLDNDKFIIYRHETLVKYPEKTMRDIINRIGLNYEKTLIEPTIGGEPWSGNSHYGPQNGIAKDIHKKYTSVLSKNEIDNICHKSNKLTDELYAGNSLLDLTGINDNLFFDYKRHKDMFDDERSLILYYGLMNSDKRKEKIKKINSYAIFALIFSFFVRIYHIPRLIKLKYFKKTGKQNYT